MGSIESMITEASIGPNTAIENTIRNPSNATSNIFGNLMSSTCIGYHRIHVIGASQGLVLLLYRIVPNPTL